MAAISAAMVKELRDRTGQAMMDCKKALQETDGDMDKAVALLRKKGMAVLEKRGGRETKEGRVIGNVSECGKVAILASLCSETDFTSKNDDFQQATQLLAEGLLKAPAAPASVEAVAALEAGNGQTVGGAINDIISKTGEKITVGDFARFDLSGPGLLFCYVHFNGKLGTMLQLDTETDAAAGHESLRALASDLAMHVTAVNPVAVSRDDVDPDLIAREKEVAEAQVQGKPAHILDKIVTGKLDKWFQEVSLLDQPFVKDDSKKVEQLLDEVSKEVGSKVTIKRFSRIQIG